MIKLLNFLGTAVGILVPLLFMAAGWGAMVERDMSVFPVVGVAVVISFGLLFTANRLERRVRLAAGLAQENIKIGLQILSGVALTGQLILVPILAVSGFSAFYWLKDLIENGRSVSLIPLTLFLGASGLLITLGWWRRHLKKDLPKAKVGTRISDSREA